MGEILNEPFEEDGCGGGGGRRLFPFLSFLSPKCEGLSITAEVSLSAKIFVSIFRSDDDRETRIRTYGRNTELLLYRHLVRAFHTRPTAAAASATIDDDAAVGNSLGRPD